MDVVIVESPAKAKTINKYLGPGYEVLASYGHVRDLPAKDGSVRPDDDFSMDWEVDAKSKKRLSDIAEAVKRADRVILATDPDREGEAISWHVLQVLKDKKVLRDKPVQRVVFNAVTKQAVQDAMRHPREIDEPLVDAYLARRALDYLVGFTLSPVLWRKLPGARSAGRVQSVALRLVCDREAEIERFRPQEYWSIVAHLRDAPPRGLHGAPRRHGRPQARQARRRQSRRRGYCEAPAGRLGLHRHIGRIEAAAAQSAAALHHLDPAAGSAAQARLRRKPHHADRPAPLRRRRIGGEPVGLITYMRTDGVDIAPEALSAARRVIEREYGARYLPEGPRRYHAKAKNAQEAHEAIRPTDMSRLPADVARFLDRDQARLYELIWKRTIASQMASAELERTTIDISARSPEGEAALRATGSVVRFDGFLALYQEGRDEEEDEEGGRLPAMKAQERLEREKIDATQHFTEPPPRYTEASLIKKMEELGIGRPSTYAQTMTVLRDRGYVRLDKKRLVPEDKGRLVTAFLESFFHRYVEYDFTADLEEKLDRISAGELSWKDVLRDFWRDFAKNVEQASEIGRAQVLEALNEILGDYLFPPRADGGDPRSCPVLRQRAAVAEARQVRRLRRLLELSRVPLHAAARRQRRDGCGRRAAGGDACSASIRRRGLAGHAPLRALRPLRPARRRREAEARQHAQGLGGRDHGPGGGAEASLACPARSALHPETGKPIVAGIGRYGPFVEHDGKYANLDGVDEVFTVGANRAVSLLAEKQGRGGPPARRRLDAQGSRRASEPRRAGDGARRALWPLRQPRQGQRHAAESAEAGGRDHGAGGGAAGREGRQGGGRQARPPRREAEAGGGIGQGRAKAK